MDIRIYLGIILIATGLFVVLCGIVCFRQGLGSKEKTHSFQNDAWWKRQRAWDSQYAIVEDLKKQAAHLLEQRYQIVSAQRNDPASFTAETKAQFDQLGEAFDRISAQRDKAIVELKRIHETPAEQFEEPVTP